MEGRGAVIVVNSLVARGSVGGRASLFALEGLGFPVWFAPTVLLPWHPGHGAGTRVVVSEDLIGDLARKAPEGEVAGCLTGYLGDAAHAEAAASLAARLREGGRQGPFLCDPVVGDHGRFYVEEAVRAAVRRLAGAADIVTPNPFELAFLAGRDPAAMTDNAQLVAAARALGRPEVVVTSAFAGAGEIANLLVTPERTVLAAHRALPRVPHGTGDLLAAAYLGRRLGGAEPGEAIAAATATVAALVERADGADELPLAGAEDALAAGMAGVRIERHD